MKRRHRFTIRFLLLLTAIAVIPSWWAGLELAEYRYEQAAVERIRKVVPELDVKYTNTTPGWMYQIGIQPTWLRRVTKIDVTGILGGRNFEVEEIPFDFDDRAFDEISDDLQCFDNLRELYLPLTRVSDKLAPKLREFKNLEFINLQQTAATSATIKQLEIEMPNTKIAFFHDLTDPWQ